MKKIVLLFTLVLFGLGAMAQEFPGVYKSADATLTIKVADQTLVGSIIVEGTEYSLRGKVDPTSNVAYLEVVTADGKKVGDLTVTANAEGVTAKTSNQEDHTFPARFKLVKQ